MRINEFKYELLSTLSFLIGVKTYDSSISKMLEVYMIYIPDIKNKIQTVINNIDNEFKNDIKDSHTNIEKELIHLQDIVENTMY